MVCGSALIPAGKLEFACRVGIPFGSPQCGCRLGERFQQRLQFRQAAPLRIVNAISSQALTVIKRRLQVFRCQASSSRLASADSCRKRCHCLVCLSQEFVLWSQEGRPSMRLSQYAFSARSVAVSREVNGGCATRRHIGANRVLQLHCVLVGEAQQSLPAPSMVARSNLHKTQDMQRLRKDATREGLSHMSLRLSGSMCARFALPTPADGRPALKHV
jgi:hypothetical protein